MNTTKLQRLTEKRLHIFTRCNSSLNITLYTNWNLNKMTGFHFGNTGPTYSGRLLYAAMLYGILYFIILTTVSKTLVIVHLH